MASRTSLKRSIEGPRVPDDNSEDEDDLIHQVEPRSQVSTLPPVFVSIEIPSPFFKQRLIDASVKTSGRASIVMGWIL